jgi:hypothetical protein
MFRDLKIFFLSGAPFGFLMGAWYYNLYGLQAGIKGGLFAGAFFGFLTFIILGLLHRQAVKKIKGKSTRETMGMHHTRAIEIQLPYPRAFDLCIQSLSLMKRCRILEHDRSKGKITAKTGLNWKTWGDTITFNIKKTGKEHLKISVSSRPTARTTLVDYGKNLENVEKIISFVKNHKNSV